MLRISAFWSTWAFWLLVALSTLTVTAAMRYRFQEEVAGAVVGPAAPQGAPRGEEEEEADGPVTLQILLPARTRALLTAPREEVVDTAGGERITVRSVAGGALGPEEVRRLLGLPGGAELPVRTPAILVTAACEAAAAARLTAAEPGAGIQVRLGYEPLPFLLFPSLRGNRRGNG